VPKKFEQINDHLFIDTYKSNKIKEVHASNDCKTAYNIKTLAALLTVAQHEQLTTSRNKLT